MCSTISRLLISPTQPWRKSWSYRYNYTALSPWSRQGAKACSWGFPGCTACYCTTVLPTPDRIYMMGIKNEHTQMKQTKNDWNNKRYMTFCVSCFWKEWGMQHPSRWIDTNSYCRDKNWKITNKKTYSLIIFPQFLPCTDKIEPVLAVFGNTLSTSLHIDVSNTPNE